MTRKLLKTQFYHCSIGKLLIIINTHADLWSPLVVEQPRAGAVLGAVGHPGALSGGVPHLPLPQALGRAHGGAQQLLEPEGAFSVVVVGAEDRRGEDFRRVPEHLAEV